MGTSSITVPDRQVLGYNVQEICNKLSDVATSAKADIDNLGASQTHWIRLAATTASSSSVVAESSIGRALVAETVSKVYITPDGSLTSNDTNYATITVYQRDSSTGGSQLTVATINTKTVSSSGSGDWTAFQKIDMGTLSNVTLAAGKELTAAITKGGTTGVATPALLIDIVAGVTAVS